MSRQWIPFGGTFREFHHADLAVEGVQVEVSAGTVDGEGRLNSYRVLLGGANTLGGGCDDCPEIRDDDLIVGYRVMVTEEELKGD